MSSLQQRQELERFRAETNRRLRQHMEQYALTAQRLESLLAVSRDYMHRSRVASVRETRRPTKLQQSHANRASQMSPASHLLVQQTYSRFSAAQGALQSSFAARLEASAVADAVATPVSRAPDKSDDSDVIDLCSPPAGDGGGGGLSLIHI